MGNEKKNGGPAFPGHNFEHHPMTDTYRTVSYPGMTLRDYFAAKADLSGAHFADVEQAEKVMGCKMPTDDIVQTLKWQAELTAKMRYLMADAMIKAREE